MIETSKTRINVLLRTDTTDQQQILSIFQDTAQEQTSYLLQPQTRNRLAGISEPLQSPAGLADWPGPLSLPNEPNTDDVIGIIKTSIVIALL